MLSHEILKKWGNEVTIVPIVLAEMLLLHLHCIYLYFYIFYSAIFLQLNLAFANKKDSYVLMGRDFCLLLEN